MKQWHIQTDNTMQLLEVKTPQVGDNQVLVAVKAIGVNRADLLQVKGIYPAPKGYDSRVPGLEFAGVIASVGAGVADRVCGEKVMGLIPSGAYSDYLVVHERELLSVPENLDFAAAATIPEAFLTSYRALFMEAQLQAGQYAWIRPASAAVGLAAIQLANAFNAIAIGSSRHLEKLNHAKQLGLRHTVIEDESLVEQLQTLTQQKGVAVIMDMLGSQWPLLLQTLQNDGKLISVGIMAAAKAEIDVFYLLMHRLKIQAITMRSQPIEQRMAMATLFNQQLLPLFATGKLQALPYQAFDFTQAAVAHEHVKNNAFSGKRVLVNTSV